MEGAPGFLSFARSGEYIGMSANQFLALLIGLFVFAAMLAPGVVRYLLFACVLFLVANAVVYHISGVSILPLPSL
jgi:hypothetical protein